MNPGNTNIGSDFTQKSDLARSDQELYRICPSKLTKHELEDLYFSLLESNSRNKKIISEQAERIKNLSNIKQTRYSAQKVQQADERKDCCINTKCMLYQQKQSINNLRRENERLAERIRKLNIRLSSAKHFSNIPVPSCRQTSSHCVANSNLSKARNKKIQSICLQTKPAEDMIVKSVGLQTEPTEVKKVRSVDVQTEPVVENKITSVDLQTEPAVNKIVTSIDLQTEPALEMQSESFDLQTQSAVDNKSVNQQTEPTIYRHHKCDENRCRTQMDELKQKIVTLQQELFDTHKEYSDRISRLENEVLSDTTERKALRKISQEDLSKHEKHMNQLMNNLRAADQLSNDLKMHLTMEKKKVTELVERVEEPRMCSHMSLDVKDEATSTEDFRSLEAELEWNGLRKCNCVPLNSQSVNKLIHLYRKGLSLEEVRCSKCCKELDICRAVQIDAVKSQSLTDEGAINIQENKINIDKGKYLNDNKKKQPKNDNTECQIDNSKRPNARNIVKIQTQAATSQHIGIPNNKSNQKVSDFSNRQDLHDSFKNKYQHDDSNKNCNLFLNKVEDKLSNKINISSKKQPLATIEKDQNMNIEKQSTYNNLTVFPASNNYQTVSEPKRSSIGATNKYQVLRIPSNVVDLKVNINTNNDEIPDVPPSSNYNDVRNCKKRNPQQLLGINHQLVQADDMKLTELNISTETPAPDLEKTKSETPATCIEDDPSVIENENISKPCEDNMSPIKDPRWNDGKSLNNTIKSPTICAKRSSRSTHDTLMDESQFKNSNMETTNNGTKFRKNDQHNSLQIPGPIPIAEPNKKVNDNDKLNLNKDVFIKNKQCHTKAYDRKSEATSNLVNSELEEMKQVNKVLPDKEIRSIQSHLRQEDNIAASIEVSRQDKIDAENDSLSNLYDTVHANIDNKLIGQENAGTSIIVGKKIIENESELQPNNEKSVADRRDSKVPIQIPRAVATYRRKSGTLCFKTVPSQNPMQSHKCKCSDQMPCGGLVSKGIQSEEESLKMTIQEQGTCTTGCSKCSRSPSHVSTELERSFMVESMEKNDLNVSGSANNSPNSDEAKSATDYNNNINYSTIAINTPNCELTTEEVSPSAEGTDEDNKPPEDSSKLTPPAVAMYNMQEKLQTIAEELERCKQMLLCQRNIPENSLETQVSEILGDWDQARSQLTLKEGVARHNIGDTQTPRCIFTLHIGTVVLSDEAVLNSRNKTLFLTWKFYDQNLSMTRMRAGRVVLFDFSTEYDILLTDDFLNYMKHEEMPIMICELDKPKQPYARCALPLRDALLHTNIRADMSLALVAGPQMIYARSMNSEASDALDAGDEMGVMDLWCMLQADAKLLPSIKRAIARPSPPMPLSNVKGSPSNSRAVMRVRPLNEIIHNTEDDLLTSTDSVSNKNSANVNAPEKNMLHRWGSSVLRLPSKDVSEVISKDAYSSILSQDYYNRNDDEFYDNHMSMSKRRNSSVLRLPNTVPKDRSVAYPKRNSNQYSNIYRYYNSKQQAKESTPSLHERGDPEEGIIINEVIANIKTSEDMKEAMIAKNRNSLHNIARLPKVEDDIISQAQSSTTSSYYKNVFGKLQRKGHSKMSYKDYPANCSENKIISDHEMMMLPVEHSDDEYDNISRKYKNIAKLCGTKSDSSKKSVTINSKKNYQYIEGIEEEPQKDHPNPENAKDLDTIDVTILWLALNEECDAMCNPQIQRVYVAYSFLGRSGADLETPVSLPKPKHYVDKCYFNFTKTFSLEDEDMPLLSHMARCRASNMLSTEAKDCIVFSVISEPPDDNLGTESCEDIGYAYIYLGDILAYSVGSTGYTEVTPVRAKNGSSVCGVLAVRIDGLDVLRRCIAMSGLDNKFFEI